MKSIVSGRRSRPRLNLLRAYLPQPIRKQAFALDCSLGTSGAGKVLPAPGRAAEKLPDWAWNNDSTHD
jgi:hypothetical protein